MAVQPRDLDLRYAGKHLKLKAGVSQKPHPAVEPWLNLVVNAAGVKLVEIVEVRRRVRLFADLPCVLNIFTFGTAKVDQVSDDRRERRHMPVALSVNVGMRLRFEV